MTKLFCDWCDNECEASWKTRLSFGTDSDIRVDICDGCKIEIKQKLGRLDLDADHLE